MARRLSSQPTDVELQILGVLWETGPQSVRRVHQALSDQRETGYSTTLKMMQVMLDKGLLQRDESVRPQIYSAVKTREATQLEMLDSLAQRIFQGSSQRLVMAMVSSGRLSPEQLQEIHDLANEAPPNE